MAGDPYRRVRGGDPLKIGYRPWNDLLNLLEQAKRRQNSATADNYTSTYGATIVDVLNESGADLDQFGILGISGSLFDPSTYPLAWAEKARFEGDSPIADSPGNNDYFGSFVVSIEPIANGAVGRCVVSGVVPCSVFFPNFEQGYIDVTGRQLWADVTGDPAALTLCVGGSAQILAAGTIDENGYADCLVRLGNRQAGLFPVFLNQTGGSTAAWGAAQTWTYDVYDLMGQLLASGVAPTTPTGGGDPGRPFGPANAAQWGFGYWDFSGANLNPNSGATAPGNGGPWFCLLFAYETPDMTQYALAPGATAGLGAYGGFTGTGTYTNFTIVNGVITAAS